MLTDFGLQTIFVQNKYIMKPTRRGQIVKFHTPNEDENPDDVYLVLEYMEDGERSRVRIQATYNENQIPWTTILYAKDFEVDELQTSQLDYYLKYGDHGLF